MITLAVSEVRRSFPKGLGLAAAYLREVEIAWDWRCPCGTCNVATEIPTRPFDQLPKGLLPGEIRCCACNRKFTSDPDPFSYGELFTRKNHGY